EEVMSQSHTGPVQGLKVSSVGSSTPPVARKCTTCEQQDEELQVQRKESSAAMPPPAPDPLVEQVLNSSGQPLERSTMRHMESRFGHDFGDVRVHTDTFAADSAKAINARAYTVGHDIVFGTSAYKPETNEGRRLLAHELAHVVQQGVGG